MELTYFYNEKNNTFDIQIPNNDFPLELQFINSMGQELSVKVTNTSGAIQLNIEGLDPGVYFVRIGWANFQKSIKFVVN